MKIILSVLPVLLVLSVFPFSAMAQTTGFKEGNEFTINRVAGDITVRCREGVYTDIAHIRCRGEYLAPSSWAKFYSEIPVDADKVRLVAFHEDGSIQEKTSRFNSDLCESKARFNLWHYTLFQRPLLAPGINEIDYFLSKNDENVLTGTFQADVYDSEVRYCYPASYYSTNMNDCRFPSNTCNRYFRDQNYCR